jgi:eukaryotic-like serine/threonine-protein kinase
MAAQKNAPLPEGLEIGGYRILRKISSGGFSIVYLAVDEEGHEVAIKEYLPSSLVKRNEGELVPLIAPESIVTYRNGLKCFFEEGRALARIMHPNVVRVINFFRANDTVYLVMTYEVGRSLQDLVLHHRARGKNGVVPEAAILTIFNQTMNGLREVHANRMLHLDFKPANVYLREDFSPILLDFGAARQTLTQEDKRLVPMYTPGFAAPELYRRGEQLGPWTDIYGVGATMFAAMMGSPPQAADQRIQNDRTDKLLDGLVKHYSVPLVDLVAWSLRVNPLERPQSVFVMQKTLRAMQVAPKTAVEPGLMSRMLENLGSNLGSIRKKLGRGGETDALRVPTVIR